MDKLPIETHNPLFGKYLYPEAKAIMEEQQDATWTAPEIAVASDKQDYLVNMSVAQSRVSNTTLGLFVEIEQQVGDLWETIGKWFPHSEIEGACSEMARMEKSVHAFFYQKMSDVLNIDPEDTLKQQQEITVLSKKLDLLKSIVSNPSEDKPLTLATLAIIEQVLLFSNFALLKSFKANGNNLIKNTLLGVDYVIDDEQLHGVLAAYLHNTYLDEYGDRPGHQDKVFSVLQNVVDHEFAVIDYIFEGEETINDITAQQLKHFILTRANDILSELKLGNMFKVPTISKPISEWFYKGIKAIKVHDFFVSGTTQYSKNWNTEAFSILPHLEKYNEE